MKDTAVDIMQAAGGQSRITLLEIAKVARVVTVSRAVMTPAHPRRPRK